MVLVARSLVIPDSVGIEIAHDDSGLSSDHFAVAIDRTNDSLNIAKVQVGFRPDGEEYKRERARHLDWDGVPRHFARWERRDPITLRRSNGHALMGVIAEPECRAVINRRPCTLLHNRQRRREGFEQWQLLRETTAIAIPSDDLQFEQTSVERSNY